MKKISYIIFFVALIGIVLLFCVFNFWLYPKKYSNLVERYAEEFDLDCAFVYAIIKAESNFDSKAVSAAGAVGLMQIMPSTATWIAEKFDEEFNKNKLFDVEINIKYGCYYLRYLFDKFGEIEAVVCAYNAGETTIRSWLDENGSLDKDKIAFEETRQYLGRVLKYYEVYKNNEKFQ